MLSPNWGPCPPEATQIPSVWPPPFRALRPFCTYQYPQGLAGAAPTIPQDPVPRLRPSGTPDLLCGAANELRSPVLSAGSQAPRE